MTDTMRRTWLVQRLNQPARSSSLLFGKDNPFSFGGGLRNGGLSTEAMTMLRDLFAFDYMGAAEFEFGAVPEALNGIAKDHKKLVSREITIDLATLAPDWRNKTKHEGTGTVWLIARKDQADEAEARIRGWAADGYRSELKETTRLSECLSPSREDFNRTDGWLELDNGFLFFTDRAMFEGTAALFGVTVEVSA